MRGKKISGIGWLVVGFALGLAINATLAGETAFEIGVGAARGKAAPDGIWWESQYETSNTLTSPSYSVGFSHVFDNRFGVRADYSELLLFKTHNVAIPNEHAVEARRRGVVSCSDGPEFCLNRWNGGGAARGVHIGGFYDFALGDWHVQPEVGALIYSYHFAMTLEPLERGAWSGGVHNGDTGDSTQNITSYARLTVLREYLWARLDFNHNVKGHDVIGIQEGPIVAAMIGVRLPL